MRVIELALVFDVRTGRAHVAGRSRLAVTQAAEELYLERNREILVGWHRFWILRVNHHTAVAQRPYRCVRRLFANEAVFDPQPVMRERILVENMPELFVEFVIAVVRNCEQAILDAERV